MNTTELLRNIIKRIKKYRLAIILCCIIFAVIFYLPEYHKKIVFTAKATLFPLNSDNEESSSSTISNLLGIGDAATKKFGNDNAVNIIELTQSRKLMQAVAAKRITSLDNKTIAEILVNEVNRNRSFWENDIQFPADSFYQNVIGSTLVRSGFTARINKNNVLELYYSNTDPNILVPVTDTIIAEITKFYIDLKTAKAQDDYNFTVIKLDSVQKILDKLDSRAIGMQKTTLFTSDKLLTYQIPKDYVLDAKEQTLRQKNILLNDKEEASWRLQKITPIVEVLDKPEPPFDRTKSSPLTMGIIGFLVGGFLASLIVIWGIVYAYIKAELHKALSEN